MRLRSCDQIGSCGSGVYPGSLPKQMIYSSGEGVIVVATLSSLAAPEVVNMTAFGEAGGG